ncbi:MULTISPECIES: flagellar basal body rod protein FlgC [unclassified Luteibacter]|uniref:flagellar basal body rod protein FlgC n=1 Tax=Luteibacter sp. PvP019 TaxID=3156436 RepID=UPI00339996BC
MSTDAIFAVTRAGLDYERARMEAASRRIATADVPVATRREALRAAGETAFAESLRDAPASDLAASAAGDAADASDAVGGESAEGALPGADTVRNVLDPSSPLADANGMTGYPDTDLAQEMSTLMSAQRGYQADIRAFNVLHGMLLKSLTIGGR